MRKFLDTFPNVNIGQLYQVYPTYINFIKELEDLDKRVRGGVSAQVEEQYELLMKTFDSFLFKSENIERFNKVYTNPIQQINTSLIPTKGVALELSEREEIEEDLQKEIKELSDKYQIDKNRIEDINEKEEVNKNVVLGEEIPTLSVEDFDIEDRFVGITWQYDTFRKPEFNLGLSMMTQGCKFYYTTFASKHFVLFKLKGMGRIIIETTDEKYSYEDLFLPTNKKLKVFMLNNNSSSLTTIFNIFKDSWDTDDESYTKLDDEFLYNAPYIYTSMQEDILWKEAELLQQSKSIALRANYIKKYFSLYSPLERICTLQMCKDIYSNLNIDRDYKSIIKDNIKNQNFYIEGLGNVRHSENILDVLTNENLLDVNYELTGLGRVLLDYNQNGQPLLNPNFKPFMYYMNNLGEEIKKSKKTFYSIFNGQTLYHTKPDVNDITYAIRIPSTDKKLMGVDDATQKDAFPVTWQQEQDFKNYQQYLPFAAGGNLSVRKMHEAREQRESTKGKIMFRDLDRKELYIASTVGTAFIYAINGQDYRYICSIYGEDNIRILGPNESSALSTPIKFFMIVNDNNDLLAVQSAIKSASSMPTKMIEKSKGVWEEAKQDIDFLIEQNKQTELNLKTSYISCPANRYPKPIWDYADLLQQIKSLDPVLTSEGKMIGEKEELPAYKDENKVEEKNKENIIIDFDNPEEPIVVIEDERSIKIKELNEEIILLQEAFEDDEDEELEQDIKLLKEKIEALKQ